MTKKTVKKRYYNEIHDDEMEIGILKMKSGFRKRNRDFEKKNAILKMKS